MFKLYPNPRNTSASPRFIIALWAIQLILLSFMSTQSKAMNRGEMRDLVLREALEKRINRIKEDPRLYDQTKWEGRSRTILCQSCHGHDGISVKPLVPNLAGQNPVYIVEQLQHFADGRRKDYWMGSLAKNFNDEDIIKIALYYSDMAPRYTGGGTPSLVGEGGELFRQHCVKCHGENGRGKEGYAMLAGQRPDYVMKMLQEFREESERRPNPDMNDVAVKLSDREIEALASYLASLD